MGNHTIRPGSEKDLETYRKKVVELYYRVSFPTRIVEWMLHP